jgi:hypothetical protein
LMTRASLKAVRAMPHVRCARVVHGGGRTVQGWRVKPQEEVSRRYLVKLPT